MDRYFQNVLIDFTERWGRGEMEKKGKAKDEEELDMKEKWVKEETKKNDGSMFCNI